MEWAGKNDIELMVLVKEDDRDAFATLHDRYQRQTIGFFYALCHQAPTANDLSQETFLRVWRIRKRYQATGPFRAYLFAVARMIWREHLRDLARVSALGDERAPEWVLHEWPTTAFGPDACCDHRAFDLAFHAALEELPEAQRLVVALRYVRGLRLEEIARALDCPINTVRSRKVLAMKKLRCLLADWEDWAAEKTPKE